MPFNAKEVLNQLTQSNNGGSRLQVMIGAKEFFQDSAQNYIKFKFPRAQYMKITLNSLDLYDVEFGKIRKFEHKVTQEFKGLYADMLKSTFEEHTGLFLSL